MSEEQRLDVMMKRLPERDQWRLLQDAVESGVEFADTTVRRLDPRMQGFLFLQDRVENRKARIEFAASPANMPYLREAAGSRNVWMSDDEFTVMVERDDAETLACFARSEEMQPHQLMYIEHKLAAHPHRQESLATAYDTRITLQKVIDRRGSTSKLALIRLALGALEGSIEAGALLHNHAPGAVIDSLGDPRALWRAYLNLRRLDRNTLLGLLREAAGSSNGPDRASGAGASSLH